MRLVNAIRLFCESDERLRRLQRAQRSGEQSTSPEEMTRKELQGGSLDPHAVARDYTDASAQYRALRKGKWFGDKGVLAAQQRSHDLRDRLRRVIHAMGGDPREAARQLGVGAKLARKSVPDSQHVAEVLQAVEQGKPIDKLVAAHVKRWKDAQRNADELDHDVGYTAGFTSSDDAARRLPDLRGQTPAGALAERYRQRIHKIARALGAPAGQLVLPRPPAPQESEISAARRRALHTRDIAVLHGGRWTGRGDFAFPSATDAQAAREALRHHYPRLRVDYTKASSGKPDTLYWPFF